MPKITNMELLKRLPVKSIKFPRQLKMMSGGCVAVIGVRTNEPILRHQHMIRFENQSWASTRLSYSLNVKKITVRPPNRREQQVLHHCDHRWCIQPGHIYLGTAKQNMIDMFQRHPTIRKQISRWMKGNKNQKGLKQC